MAAKRDANGRFVKGTGGGPGRPKKSREQRYYEIMRQRVTFKDWRHIIDVAVARAKAGDKEARKFLAEYLMGKPEQVLNVKGGLDISVVYVNWDADADDSD